MPQKHIAYSYSFEELSDAARTNAFDACRDWNTSDEFWHEYVQEDVKEIAVLMGIEIDRILFSGFSNQGDGACFEGTYSYKRGSVKAVQVYAPQDSELHEVVGQLYRAQAPFFFRLSATVKHRGRYCHEMCTDIAFDSDPNDGAEDLITDSLRDFMRWIYKRVETEYIYQRSDEVVQATIEANGVRFTDAGELFNT